MFLKIRKRFVLRVHIAGPTIIFKYFYSLEYQNIFECFKFSLTVEDYVIFYHIDKSDALLKFPNLCAVIGIIFFFFLIRNKVLLLA